LRGVVEFRKVFQGRGFSTDDDADDFEYGEEEGWTEAASGRHKTTVRSETIRPLHRGRSANGCFIVWERKAVGILLAKVGHVDPHPSKQIRVVPVVEWALRMTQIQQCIVPNPGTRRLQLI
jgi:hypothetical protein